MSRIWGKPFGRNGWNKPRAPGYWQFLTLYNIINICYGLLSQTLLVSGFLCAYEDQCSSFHFLLPKAPFSSTPRPRNLISVFKEGTFLSVLQNFKNRQRMRSLDSYLTGPLFPSAKEEAIGRNNARNHSYNFQGKKASLFPPERFCVHTRLLRSKR